MKSVERSCKNCRNCFTIEFKDQRIAAKLLRIRQLKIAGSTFFIKAANEQTQPPAGRDDHISTEQLQPPSAQESPKHILNALNDHCLCEIFGHIEELADFNSIANVCTRFNKIAKLVFPAKIRSSSPPRYTYFEHFVSDNDGALRFDWHKLAQIENFLCNFGSSIEALAFDTDYFSDTNATNLALKIIDAYCKNIKDLYFKISDDQIRMSTEIRSIFSKLQCLSLKFNKTFDAHHGFLSACTGIQKLRIYGLPYYFQMPETPFPKLKRFKIYNFDEAIHPCVSLERFLMKNRQLEELTLYRMRLHNAALLSQTMLNLRQIKLGRFSGSNDGQFSLPDHTAINFNTFCDGTISQYFRLQNITKIELRELRNGMLERDLIAVAQHLRNLRKIKIHLINPIPFDTVKQVVHYASKMTKFVQAGDVSADFDENNYSEILDVILAREEHRPLTMKFKYYAVIDCNNNKYDDMYYKLITLNEHPRLSVSNYYKKASTWLSCCVQ